MIMKICLKYWLLMRSEWPFDILSSENIDLRYNVKAIISLLSQTELKKIVSSSLALL